MSEFKGTKGDWRVNYNNYGHITSVRSVDSNRTVFVSRVNNKTENNANMILAKKAPEMLEMLQSLENDSNSIPLLIWEKIQLLIKEATEL